jgi:phospholipase C
VYPLRFGLLFRAENSKEEFDMHHFFTRAIALATAAAFSLFPVSPAFANDNDNGDTNTPIKHLVVIFQENVSFDHYFGTYPNAVNPAGEPTFRAKRNTPSVNGLSLALLTNNPNLNPANGAGATNPFRLDRSQAVTRDQGHGYLAEQQAFDNGVMDLFPKFVGKSGPPPAAGAPVTSTTGLNLGFFDGNTVTAMWNYAQHFAMSDNSYSTGFGPSTPGALNLISGQTNGAINASTAMFAVVDGGAGSLTDVSDADPAGDVCSSSATFTMKGQNVGNLLHAAGVTWGSFMGGFDLTAVNSNGTTGCKRSSAGLPGTTADYIPHHAWFQYYASTANPAHTRPASVAEIGHDGPANHNYDLHDFYDAVSAGNFPAVSFLKAQAFQDGHAGYSDPLDEQTFLVNVINFLQSRPEWNSTAVVIMYDDSDGWYDHQIGPILNQSHGAADALTGRDLVAGLGTCGSSADSTALPGVDSVNTHALGRCGLGPRQPLLVVSPWARRNFVDHSVTDQSSVLRFIEDNWLQGQRIGQGSFDAITNSITQMFNFNRDDDDQGNRTLLLDPLTGQILNQNNQ